MASKSSSDDPIIISGGSPLKLRIQSTSEEWLPIRRDMFKHSDPNAVARRLSLDYVDDGDWIERDLYGQWELTIPYDPKADVVIKPVKGSTGQGLLIAGPLARKGRSTQQVQTGSGSFGQIRLNGKKLGHPTKGKLRIAIHYY